MMNLLSNLTPDLLATRGLAWEHAPLAWEPLPEGGIRVTTPARSDYFRDPGGKMVNDNAPFLWTNATGDFVAQAHVRPAFDTTYDSGVLMVRHDATTWAKLCFERTDFGTTAAVSVVTRGVSDDANGVDITQPDLWLQAARAGQMFGLHYSLDGHSWRMVRLFHLDVPQTIRVGVVAQCPVGPGTTVDLLSFTLDPRSIKNVRAGE